jgi:predicted nucleic acid-binding protein
MGAQTAMTAPRVVLDTNVVLAASADALVAGEGDLLELAAASPVPILSPAEMRSRLDAGIEMG